MIKTRPVNIIKKSGIPDLLKFAESLLAKNELSGDLIRLGLDSGVQ
jgi:hypothetical protein